MLAAVIPHPGQRCENSLTSPSRTTSRSSVLLPAKSYSQDHESQMNSASYNYHEVKTTPDWSHAQLEVSQAHCRYKRSRIKLIHTQICMLIIFFTVIISCSCEHNLSSSPRLSDGRYFEGIGCAGNQSRYFDMISTGISLSTIFKSDEDILRTSPFDFTRICDLVSVI